MAASEMEVDLASHRIVRAAPGFLGLIFGPGPYKTMFGPIIHFIHRISIWNSYQSQRIYMCSAGADPAPHTASP